MARRKHPKPEIEAALKYAEEHQWRVETGGSHAWGKMYCPTHDASCGCGEYCITSIWSTPQNPGNHGRQLQHVVDRCVAARQKAATAASENNNDD